MGESELGTREVPTAVPSGKEAPSSEKQPVKRQPMSSLHQLLLRFAVYRSQSPDRWGFATLNDQHRTNSYVQAIEQKVEAIRSSKEQVVVVVNGSGSGVLGMAAARAGATAVVVIEKMKPLAKLVRQVVKDNELGDKIVVTHDDSEDIVEAINSFPSSSSPGVDLFITDVGDGGVRVLNEGIFELLGSLRKATVLTEKTQFIPERLECMGSLVECHPQTEPISPPVDEINGFDLRLFNIFRRNGPEPVRLSTTKHKLLSQPELIFTFHMGYEAHTPEDREVDVTSTEDGCCTGFAMWYRIVLSDSLTLDSGDLGERSAWHQAIHFFDDACPVTKDSVVPIIASHDCSKLKFTCEVEREGDAMHSLYREFPMFQGKVSRWHFGMINDIERNHTYDLAISQAVKSCPNPRVLDIGSGSGLLAMFAARAGASDVTTCELVKPLAKVASQIVGANGYKHINVVNKKSNDLVIGEEGDMKARANILVSEIVDVGLLGEHVIPTVNHAKKHLLEDGAKIIPAKANVFAMMLNLPHQAAPLSFKADTVCGFNLQEYNTFRKGLTYEQIRLRDIDHSPLSAAFPCMDVDFTGPGDIEPQETTVKVKASASGRCTAIAFWFHLHLDEDHVLTTGPENETTCWQQAVQLLDEGLEVEEGREYEIEVMHNTTRVTFKPVL